MKGWFDAFRIDGGPTLYSYSNRTPVTGDVPLVIVFVIFGTIFTAFLVIFPGIRKEVNARIILDEVFVLYRGDCIAVNGTT